MIKKVLLGAIITVALLFAYNLVTQTIAAIRSQERLSESADVVYKLQAQNKTLKEKLSQVQSPEFIEEEVRNKLGLSKKGETMVVIPEEKLKLVLGTNVSVPVRLPNWLGWLKVFFK